MKAMRTQSRTQVEKRLEKGTIPFIEIFIESMKEFIDIVPETIKTYFAKSKKKTHHQVLDLT